ncbi:MAG: ABC transporter substrate-binding protein, partial [Burkholderiales bacterium]
ELAFSPIVGEGKAKDKEFLALFRDTKRDSEKTKKISGLEEYWNSLARKNYAQAVELANRAASIAR